MKEYGGSERNKYRGDETGYIVIYYRVLFVCLNILLFFVFMCVCVVEVLTKEQIITIIALQRK